jgi:DNA-directed RNA polymerase specialized sigma24 family protein
MVLSRTKQGVTELTPSKTTQRDTGVSADTALAGILALLVDEREARVAEEKDAEKTEVLLAKAGLAAPEIASLMGKNTGAVQKAIQRGRS